MRTNVDLTPFRRSTVGFDRLFDLLESGQSPFGGETYPPFDLTSDGEDRYRITLAVAGFKPEEVDITAQQNLLIVSGRKQDEDGSRYIHRGIAARAFERRFGLADHVRVKSADLKDGILSIELEREIPEEKKPRRIEISGGDDSRRLESESSASQARNDNVKELAA